MTMRTLPMLESCGEDFSRMRGEGPTRFCEKCEEDVHALATAEEARALFRRARTQGATSVCVRYLRAAGVATALASSGCSHDAAPAQIASIRPPAAADLSDAGTDAEYWMGRRAVRDCDER